MLCARVVRGISSTENDVTPRSAISRMVSIDPSGRRKPTRTWSRRKQRKIVLAGRVVRAVTEHLDDDVGGAGRPRRDSGRILAPLATYSASGKAGLGAGPRFHDDLEAGLQQARDHRREPAPRAARPGRSLEGLRLHEPGSDRENHGS